MKIFYTAFLTLLFSALLGCTQDTANAGEKSHDKPTTTQNFKVVAYYYGDGNDLQRYDFNQLTHVIYSFLHLKGSALSFDSDKDKQTLEKMVALKKQYPHLKVII